MTETRAPKASEAASTLPRLEAGELILRLMEDRDVEDLLTMWGDPETMRFMSGDPLKDRQEGLRFIEDIRTSVRARTLYQWGFALAEDDRVVGTCTLASLDWRHLTCEIGFALAPAHRRRGLTSRAVARVLEHAFSDLGMRRVEADVDPRNTPSLRLLERQGFVREGLLRARYLEADEVQDALMLGLLAEEWREGREA
ncbi:MAG: GNAT family protein [Acidobacteriota bacterium]